MSAETKLELLGLIDSAVRDGWAHTRACGVLDLQDVRAHRWRARLRETGSLQDGRPVGDAVHRLLACEEQAILDLIEQWGWVDRSHRKLAHRGSYTGVVFVSPSTPLRVAALSIVVGGTLYIAGEHAAGRDVWGAAVALLAAELAFEVVRTVLVDHHLGVDTIALVAMVGALALGQEFAGVIVGLMFSGGAALEDIASTRARRELTALIQRAPKVTQLRVGDQLEQVPVAQVETGDVVVVRTGEVVPVDGTVVGAEAVVDTSIAERRAAARHDRTGNGGVERVGKRGLSV